MDPFITLEIAKKQQNIKVLIVHVVDLFTINLLLPNTKFHLEYFMVMFMT